MNKRTKNIISWVIYGVGLIIWGVFLYMNHNINMVAWLNTIGAGFGVFLLCLSSTIRQL